MLLFTVQPKIDTKGHCYTLALQQILTGIYIAELCLIGLFSLRQATGPSIMMIVLFVATALFNATTNKYFAPLEKFLPADLAQESEAAADEGAPLLAAAEEGEADAQSHLQHIGSHVGIPPKYLSPLARFFEPHVFASHRAMTAWLRTDPEFDEDDVPEYDDEEIKKAYLNPVFTSQTPVVWLPRDGMGVSKREVRENEEEGLKCSDEGAWVDEKGQVEWSVNDFEKVPVFKEGTRW